jgi:hypothetical protein
MTTYGPANTQAAWYQDNYPGAAMSPNCGVIHTTEGTTLPGYSGGAEAPNYTAVPDFKESRLRFFAHFPDERSSRALVNSAGGVETNTLNALQIELVGTCAPGTRDAWKRAGAKFIFWPDAPDWALRDLAKFMVDMKRRHGIPLSGPPDSDWVAYPESYGPGGQRFSFAKWRGFTGWCGHQHVPENVHGDPGALPFSKLLRVAQAILDGPTKPAEADPNTPRWDRICELADYIAAHTGDPDKKAAARTIKAAASPWSADH